MATIGQQLATARYFDLDRLRRDLEAARPPRRRRKTRNGISRQAAK